jgi:hypothetical protein
MRKRIFKKAYLQAAAYFPEMALWRNMSLADANADKRHNAG